MKEPEVFIKYRDAIEAELEAVLFPYASEMYTMLRYHMGWVDEAGKPARPKTGKALRPTLCLLTCESISGEYIKAMPAAAALELVHNYSLIHDDVQDDDPVRRHRPSVWKIWGKPQAINAGTALRIIAGLSLYGLIDKGIGSSVVMAAQALLDRTTLRLLEGQYMDIDFESRTDIKADEYIEMVSGKTGALIACSIEMGALIAGGVSDTAPFGEFGEAMGLAFQIRDDWLGIWGDPDQTGKGRGNDILRKKKSLPVVEAFSRAGAPALKKMRSIYDKPELGADDVLSVMNIMDDLKINEIVQARVDHDCEKAEGLAKKLFIGSARDELCDLLKFLSRREH